MVKGRITYVPKTVIIELDWIKQDFPNIENQSDAFKKMADFSMMGRDLFKNLGYEHIKKQKERRK